MAKELSLQEAEKLLEERYKGQVCSFTYYTKREKSTAYGTVDNISFDVRRLPKEKIVRIIMNNTIYEIELSELQSHLKVLKRKNDA